MKNVMGTGSRSLVVSLDRKDVYGIVETRILEIAAGEDGGIVLFSGLAEGFDEMIAKIGIRNGIDVVGFLPNLGYPDYYWRRNSLTGYNRIHHYREMFDQLTDCVVCCSSIYEDGEHSNFVRNRIMVAAADHALVYNPKSTGTAHAVSHLRANNVPFEVYPFIVQKELF